MQSQIPAFACLRRVKLQHLLDIVETNSSFRVTPQSRSPAFAWHREVELLLFLTLQNQILAFAWLFRVKPRLLIDTAKPTSAFPRQRRVNLYLRLALLSKTLTFAWLRKVDNQLLLSPQSQSLSHLCRRKVKFRPFLDTAESNSAFTFSSAKSNSVFSKTPQSQTLSLAWHSRVKY
jgi:hypothetical protein